MIYNVNFNISGSLLGKSNEMSDDDGVFGLQFICSVKMMSINWEPFLLFKFAESIEPERTHLTLLSCELVEECEPPFSFNLHVASTAPKCDLVSFQEITVAD